MDVRSLFLSVLQLKSFFFFCSVLQTKPSKISQNENRAPFERKHLSPLHKKITRDKKMYVYSEALRVWKQPVKTKGKGYWKDPIPNMENVCEWEIQKKRRHPKCITLQVTNTPQNPPTRSLSAFVNCARTWATHSEGPFLCQGPGYEPV
jgi:hypothetical protein